MASTSARLWISGWSGTRTIENDTWLKEFEQRVLEPMDLAAKSKIRFHAKRVALKTAISPFPLVDTLAVLYNVQLMLRDLAAIYGRRLERREAAILTVMILFQVYVAGEAQEFMEASADEVQEWIIDGASGVFGRVASAVSAKLAEGTLNALVVIRVGSYARRRLRPVR